MTVYVILLEDRHIDPVVEVWADKDAAIERARSMAQEACRFPDDYGEEQIADWIFYARYSCENDRVRVTEHEIQRAASEEAKHGE